MTPQKHPGPEGSAALAAKSRRITRDSGTAEQQLRGRAGCVALVGEKSCPDRLVRMCGQPVTIGRLPLCENCRYQFDRIFLGLREAEIHLFTHALVMAVSNEKQPSLF